MRSGESEPGFVVFIAAIAALGGFLFGFDSGVINGTISALQETFDSNSVATGFSVASMLLGCAAGALVAGPFADRIGRKGMLLLTSIGFAVSAWGSGIANSEAEFIAYRLLGGVAVGAASVLSPAYISEIAPTNVRGRLASLQQLAIVLGIVGAFLSNYVLAKMAGSAKASLWLGFPAWRWMFWMECAPALALLVGTFLIPESPRYLVARGRFDEARAIFARLSGEDAGTLVESVRSTLHTDRPPRLGDLVERETRRVYPLVWVGIGLSVFQQFVGINVVFYYGEVLWRAAGFSEEDALVANVASGVVNVLATFVAIALVDRLGRKPLLSMGSWGMGLALGLLAICFSRSTLDPTGVLHMSPTTGSVALVAANVYVFCFGVSWGPCVWVLLGEMFPNQYRAAALSVSASVQWIANFVVIMTFPSLLETLGLPLSYAIYAGFAALSLVFVRTRVRETKGLSLEEMTS